MIDTRDASDAAVAALTTSAHDGSLIELTGPASIDYHQAASAVGRALGRDVTYFAIPPDAAAAAVKSFGADDWTAGIIHDYCKAYSGGFGDFVTDGVRPSPATNRDPWTTSSAKCSRRRHAEAERSAWPAQAVPARSTERPAGSW